MADHTKSSSWLYVTFLSFLSFSVLSKLIYLPFPLPKKFRNQSKKIWLWGNIATSWVHSLITAFLSVCSICNKPSMLADMINPWTNLAYYTIALSLGYFIYDFLNNILNDFKKSLCISLHHVIVVTAFVIALSNKKYIPFALVALLMEVNSVFLHSRRLMRMSDVSPTNMLFKVNGILLMITFVIFRLVSCGWMFNFIMMNRHLLPTLHFAFGIAGMCVLTPLNIFLLKQVWTSDSKLKSDCQREKEREAEKELQVAGDSTTKLKQFLQLTIANAIE